MRRDTFFFLLKNKRQDTASTGTIISGDFKRLSAVSLDSFNEEEIILPGLDAREQTFKSVTGWGFTQGAGR